MEKRGKPGVLLGLCVKGLTSVILTLTVPKLACATKSQKFNLGKMVDERLRSHSFTVEERSIDYHIHGDFKEEVHSNNI